MKTAIKILILLFITKSFFAQEVYYKQYTIDDGLALSQVLSICLDNKNQVWAGTNGGGLSVFDGFKFNNYTIEDGLAGNYVNSLFKASNDNIIIGTDKGISIFDGKKITAYIDTINDFNFKIWDIKEDINGNYILATGKGLLKFKDGNYTRYISDSLINNTHVFNILLANDGKLWLGTNRQGLISIDKGIVKQYTTKDGLADNIIRTLAQDTLGQIWVGTEHGISCLTKDDIFISNGTQTNKASFLSKNNELYFITNQGWFINYKTDISKGIRTNNVIEFSGVISWCITQDYEGNFWIGSDNGLIMFNKPSKFIEYNNISNNDNTSVYAMYFSKENYLYFNEYQDKTYATKVNIHNINKTKTDFVKTYFYNDDLGNNNIVTNRIWDIQEDYDKNIWFAAWGGISMLDTNNNFHNYARRKIKKDSKFFKSENYQSIDILPTEYFNDILLAKDSSLYFASYNGIVRYYKDKFYNLNTDYPELYRKAIVNLIEDNKGRILGATKNNGFFIIDKKKIKFLNTKNQSFSVDKVNYIIQDYKNNYWIATAEGFFNYDGKKFKQYTIKDGFISSNVYVLEVDNYNNLIIGTDKGFNRLDLKKYYYEDSLYIRYYGKEEGFSGLECNLTGIYKDYRGHIWFGTVKGVIEYIPENDIPNDIEPNTFLTKISVFNEKHGLLEYSDSIDVNNNLPINLSLHYDVENLRFEFIGTSKRIPSKVKFQYKLYPLNNEWVDVKNTNEIIFPFMPDGDYILYIRSSNDEGIWDSTPVEYKFIVTPPIWKTTWFIIVVIIFGIILVVIFIKYREKQLKKEKEILEIKVAERTQEVVKQKEIVEEKNKDITDSINYARNIQRALLPSDEFLDEKLKNSMIFFRPRDIVSGDFYWVSNKKNRTYLSAADSTGHGVPGAFMSMLGMAFLDEIVGKNNKLNSAEVLNQMRKNVINSLKQKGKEGEARDGMDVSLSVLDWENKKLEFAGANNPLYLISKDSEKTEIINNKEKNIIKPVMEHENGYNLFEIKADKMPIGYYIKNDDFTNHTLEIKNEDTIYMFSDGLPDQFGGPKGKKFKYKPFKKLLLDLENYEMKERVDVINKVFVDWLEGYEQIDDVIVLGVKFNI